MKGPLSSCGTQASCLGDFSCCRAWALGTQASVVAACELSSFGTQALKDRHGFICGAWV